MADQPGSGPATGAFDCQVRADLSSAAMQAMAPEAAFAPLRLSVKSCQKAGVLGLLLVLAGDDVIVASVPANIKVVGGSERLWVAKVAGYLLVLFRFGVQAAGLASIVCFLRSRGESQAAWEGLLMDLYRRGLEGRNLRLVITDECEGLAAALQTVYPQVPHQRCWVHKIRNILEHVRKRDYDRARANAQAIYRAESRQAARASLPVLPLPLAKQLSGDGETLGAGPAGVAGVLQLPAAAVAQAAYDQCDRALLCRGATPHPPHGLLCHRRQRRSDHLCHL